MTSVKLWRRPGAGGKVTYFDVNAPSYPITVEFNYSIKFKGILGLPGYDMQTAWQSVQHSVFEVEVPADLGVRYKLVNTAIKPVGEPVGQ